MTESRRNQWDRMLERGEGPAAHELFLVYVSLGAARTVAKVAEQTGRRMQLCSSLAHKFHWVRRSKAYDGHLRRVKELAIENQSKIDALIWKERETEYRDECHKLSEKLLAKVKEMIEFPLYEVQVKELQPVLVDGQPISDSQGRPVLVEKTVIHKPFKWAGKDIVGFSEVQDKLHRMAFGVPTSRTAVELTPPQTLEERINQARANMKFWVENKLERAVQRILAKDPSLNEDEVRQELLDEAPIWFASDLQIPDPLMITEYIPPAPLPLGDEEEIPETEGVN